MFTLTSSSNLKSELTVLKYLESRVLDTQVLFNNSYVSIKIGNPPFSSRIEKLRPKQLFSEQIRWQASSYFLRALAIFGNVRWLVYGEGNVSLDAGSLLGGRCMTISANCLLSFEPSNVTLYSQWKWTFMKRYRTSKVCNLLWVVLEFSQECEHQISISQG
jgi:hypothetical protein